MTVRYSIADHDTEMAIAWGVPDLPETRARCDRMVAKRLPADQYNEHGELLCNLIGCREPALRGGRTNGCGRGLCRRHARLREHGELGGKRRRQWGGGGIGRKLGPRHA